jgi:hypothetical protein
MVGCQEKAQMRSFTHIKISISTNCVRVLVLV